MSIRLNLFFLTFLLTSHGVQASDVADQSRAIETLQKHKFWQSITVINVGELAFPGIQKKWEIKPSEKGNQVVLQERTELSIDFSKQPQEFVSQTVVVGSKPIKCGVFSNMPFNSSARFEILSDDRLLLTYDHGFKFQVVLIPATGEKETRAPIFNIGMAEAPIVGSAGPALGTSPKISYSNGFLRHSPSHKVSVQLDESFPPQFRASVLSALNKWNDAIGFKAYSTELVSKKVDALDCLSRSLLCIRWTGPTDKMGWIGWGGIAANSFDPETGILIGGVVTIQNMISSDDLVETPDSIVARYKNGDLSSSFFASLMLRKEEFKKYRHPFEADLVESLLLHEIGHTNGMSHDFSASNGGNPRNISESVMDYLPFPVVFLNLSFGERDVSRIQAAYGTGPQDLPYDGCSDSMEQGANEINCMKGDWGPPEDWYLDLISQSPNGIYETVVEFMTGLPIRRYLDVVAKFFKGELTATNQAQKIEDFICSHKERVKIQKDLKQEFGIHVCRNP